MSEFVQNQKLVWSVLDARINFVQDKSEWNNTEVIFEIKTNKNQTVVTLTHKGLVPKLECFSDCSEGWKHYFQGSLKKLIETGVGEPDPVNFSSRSEFPI